MLKVEIKRPLSILYKGCKKEQVRQWLEFCTADFWSSLAEESAVQKPKYGLTWYFLSVLYWPGDKVSQLVDRQLEVVDDLVERRGERLVILVREDVADARVLEEVLLDAQHQVGYVLQKRRLNLLMSFWCLQGLVTGLVIIYVDCALHNWTQLIYKHKIH